MSRRTVTALMSAAIGLAAMISAAPANAADADADAAKITKLKDYVPLSRSAPTPEGDRFTFKTTTDFWSVVAVDPTAKIDTVPYLYADKGETDVLGWSFETKGKVDFIAVDSNRRPLSSYYVRVKNHESSDGSYDIELAQGSEHLSHTPQDIAMSDSSVVAVRDTVLLAGTHYRFVLGPHGDAMKGSVFLVASEPDQEDSWVQYRSESVGSDVGKPGEPAIVDFTPTRTDTYGVVVVSEGEPGTFSLARVTP